MIDLRYVKKLIEMLDESTVDSIEISGDKGMKIRLSKTATARGPVTMAMPAATPAPTAAPSSLLEVKSPMVGTYYASPEPGSKPYLTVGDRIKKGQVLCIIEAMKIMNEIESEFDGVVREILADNAHAVEYGQVLVRVDPNG